MTAHAVIPPSSSHELAHCSMSALMRWTYPDRENAEAAEGTAAHWVASETLSSYLPGNSVRTTRSYVGETAPNGILIDEDITDSAFVYTNHVLKVAQHYGCLSRLRIEEKIDCKTVHDLSFGTPDLWFLVERNGGYLLYLYDFKHGNRLVEAYMNWQLIHYVSGILDLLRGQIADLQIEVVMVVVQPRAHHHQGSVREWRVNAEDLRGPINQLHNQALEAMTVPVAKSGTWCRDCAGRLSCEAFNADINAALSYASVNVPTDMSPHEIGVEKSILQRSLAMLKYRMSAIDSMIEHHGGCPGWTIERGKGNKKWESQYTPELLKAMGVECKEVPITPSQAIASGVDETLVNSMTYRPTTGAKIVSDENTLAARVFAKGK